jgi:4-hydroxy-4-methyl-2-oxoglutarate aldolase
MSPLSTAEICERFRGMYVPAVSDAMYELGLPEPVLPSELRALHPDKSFVGIAFTLEGVEIVPAVSWDEGKKRIASYLQVFEKLTPNSVIVSKNTGNFVGHFGELTGNSAMKHGCVGVVLDGNLRDTAGLREIGLQVYYRDVNPRSGMGRWEMTSFQQPVTIGEVTVHPGDLVIADFDGILVVPQADIPAVLKRAEEIVGIESNVRDDMRRGMSPLEGLAKHGHI